MPLKEKVIQKVEKLDDLNLLKELDQWLDDEINETAKFSSKEINEVKEGYSQYLAGKTYTQEEAQQQFEKWLSGK